MNVAELVEHLRNGMETGKIDPNEPAFLLSGTDILAPKVLEFWASELTGLQGTNRHTANAFRVATEMRRWPIRFVPGQSPTGQRVRGFLLSLEPEDAVS